MIPDRVDPSQAIPWTLASTLTSTLTILATLVVFEIGLSTAALAAERPVGIDREELDLDLYAAILDQHTETTVDTVGVRVDYAKIGSDPRWEKLVSQVQGARPSMLRDRNAKIAFWINAYNILTIDLVARHYPLESIKDIGSFFSPVWDLDVATIEGKPISLGTIEHEILRPMAEPRIHSAIVCASTSCPALSRRPFRAGRLDADLSASMSAWLASDTKGVSIDRNKRVVRISKIFDWFEEDFETEGGVLATIANYVDTEDARWLRNVGRRASIRFFDYDWSLNDLSH